MTGIIIIIMPLYMLMQGAHVCTVHQRFHFFFELVPAHCEWVLR